MNLTTVLLSVIDIGPPDVLSGKTKLTFFVLGMVVPVIVGLYIVAYLGSYKPMGRIEMQNIWSLD